MDFAYSIEQESWRTTVREFLADQSPVAVARSLHERGEGHDPQLWRRMGDLGMHGLHLPERWGGQGFGGEELAIVVEELGRVLTCTPYLVSTGVAATMLHHLAEGPAAALLPGVATGERVGTVALWERDRGWRTDPSSVTAELAGEQVVVSGTKVAVPFGVEADLLLITARRGDTPLLVAVQATAEGLVREGADSLDLTSRFATLTLEQTPATILAEGPAVDLAVQLAVDYACVLLSVGMVGGSQACLDAARLHALQRHQFGRPIGSFQAIKHLFADMLAELELARSAALYAVWALQAGKSERRRAASLAKALTSDAYLFIADAALHVHGGMGFTWEHDVHLFLRRARSDSLLFGDSAHHREIFLQEAQLTDS